MELPGTLVTQCIHRLGEENQATTGTSGFGGADAPVGSAHWPQPSCRLLHGRLGAELLAQVFDRRTLQS